MLELAPTASRSGERGRRARARRVHRRTRRRTGSRARSARAQEDDVAEDWAERWRTSTGPSRGGPFWIGPSWEGAPDDAVAIVIDPGPRVRDRCAPDHAALPRAVGRGAARQPPRRGLRLRRARHRRGASSGSRRWSPSTTTRMRSRRRASNAASERGRRSRPALLDVTHGRAAGGRRAVANIALATVE